jgi:hypothetical protein
MICWKTPAYWMVFVHLRPRYLTQAGNKAVLLPVLSSEPYEGVRVRGPSEQFSTVPRANQQKETKTWI